MKLVTVGTVAFDTIETPYGKAERVVGGAATYRFSRYRIKVSEKTRDQFRWPPNQRRRKIFLLGGTIS